MSEENGKLEEIKELLLPARKFKEIIQFIEGISAREDFEKNLQHISQKIEEEKENNPYLEGILRIEHEVTLDNKNLLVIVVDEDEFPPNVLTGPGRAYIAYGIAFISSGFSESAHEMIRRHELYHLEKMPSSISNMPVIRNIPIVSEAHEVETVLAANLFQDPIGTARVPLEALLKSKNFVERYIRHFRKQIKNVVFNSNGGRRRT